MVQAIEQALVIPRFSPKNFVRVASLSATPEILLYTDEDDTRLPWKPGVEHYRKTCNSEYLENNKLAFTKLQNKAVFIGTTGLDFATLQWIQRTTGVLNGFPPTDIEITNNGLEIRVNDGGHRPEDWLDPKNKIPPDSGYEHYIKTEAGYASEIFYTALKNKLKEFEFRKVIDGDNFPSMALPNCIVYEREGELPAHIVFSYGESAIYFVEIDLNKGDDYNKLYSSLAKNIIKEYHELTSKTKNIKYEISAHGNYSYIFFSPHNGITVNKQTALGASLEFFPRAIRDGLKFVISAGDSGNDKHLISPIVIIDGRSVSNYSIITGRNKITEEAWFKEALEANPRRMFWDPDQPGNIGSLILAIAN